MKIYLESTNGVLQQTTLDSIKEELDKCNYRIELFDIDDENNLYFRLEDVREEI